MITPFIINPLPSDKIWSKLEPLAHTKLNVNETLNFGLESVENFVGKGENAVYQHILLFSTMFSKALFFRVVKSRDCVVKS